MAVEFTDREAFAHAYSDYIRQVNESEGFDLENVTTQMPMVRTHDQNGDFQLVYLYAKLGIHRFDLIVGRNIQLNSVTKYYKTIGCCSCYFITLVASNPPDSSEHVFQVRVDEKKANRLSLKVPISRLRPSPLPESSQSPLPLPESSQSPLPLPLPEWPSLDAISDTNRFLLVKESELESSCNNWIHLYLLLQVWKEDGVHDLAKLESNLKIVKVVIETIDEEDVPRNERPLRLNATSAIAYITFKGAAIPQMSEDVERKAIIRRVFDKRTGELSLRGHLVGENRPRLGADEAMRRFIAASASAPAPAPAAPSAAAQAWIQWGLDHP